MSEVKRYFNLMAIISRHKKKMLGGEQALVFENKDF